MNSLIIIANCIFYLSITPILLVFIIYPSLLAIRGGLFPSMASALRTQHSPPLSITLIVVFHNAAHLLPAKLENIRVLHQAGKIDQAFLCSDGSNDGSSQILNTLHEPFIHVSHTPEHFGKALGLNQVAPAASGDILVFSDMDAIIDPESLSRLVHHFHDPGVGGVCGQRVISKRGKPLHSAQSRYIQFDSLVKRLESRTGSITSNDGKIYAIRKSLFRPIDPHATDDLFTCLSVVKQGFRFIFEPQALAHIYPPSRSMHHELQRRRRIVARSLHGIFVHKQTLNPFHFGIYALGLIINKVLRRCLPLSLIGLFISSGILALYAPFMFTVFCLLSLFFASSALYPLLNTTQANSRYGIFAQKLVSTIFYFLIGNLGTLLGLIDFFQGKRYDKWSPVKTDA